MVASRILAYGPEYTCEIENRYTGETGICTYLHYDKDTGRLSEGKFNVEDET